MYVRSTVGTLQRRNSPREQLPCLRLEVQQVSGC